MQNKIEATVRPQTLSGPIGTKSKPLPPVTPLPTRFRRIGLGVIDTTPAPMALAPR
ncbi:MAG: hypothetical protein AMXMBFR64_02670 [Myxococcales bacterium]